MIQGWQYEERIDELEARIAELEAELLLRLHDITRLMQERNKAEAELARLKLEVESVRDEFCGDCEYLPRGWHS